MENKKNFLSGFVAGLFLALIVIISTVLVQAFIFKSRGGLSFLDRAVVSNGINGDTLNKLQFMEEVIKNNYALDPVDDAELENGVYRGLVQALGDPYSAYFSPQEMVAQQDKLDGVYYGIGASVYIDEETGYAALAEIFENSPSMKAGLMEEDLIKEIDGKSIKGMELDDIIALVRGDKGTKVAFLIQRKTPAGIRDLTITVTRDSVPRQSVKSEMLEDKTGYILITEFDTVTVDQFTEAVATLTEQGMEALILDMRGNPGGNFAACIDVARHILPKGIITYTLDRNGERVDYDSSGAYEIKVPMVVLVNGGTASAAEIVSGAIKDHKKGTLVGTVTYGKGIVQRYIGMSDGSSIKLTTSKYYTPNGNYIHEVGIEPDVIVEPDRELFEKTGRDNQLEKAMETLKNQKQSN